MKYKDIEEASVDYQISNNPMAIGGYAFGDIIYKMNINHSFIAGAKWALNNLWKPADGDDLPEIDKEVIALVGLEGLFEIPPDEPIKLSYKVVFAHRPPPNTGIAKTY